MASTNGQYDFLNQYLQKVSNDATNVDPNIEKDDNDFFDTPSESDEQPAEEDIEYGLDDNSDEEENSAEDHQNSDSDVLDYLLGDDNPYAANQQDDDQGEEEASEQGQGIIPFGNPSSQSGRLGNKISNVESQGSYSAFNSKGGGAGAVGKYQFRWNIWKDSIEKITGVKSREEFQKSPQAQEKYFSWYEKHYLKPAADKLKPYNKAGLSDDQLAQLVHFRGESGARKYLAGKMKDQPESYNMPISKYIAKHQTGGQVENVQSTKLTPSQQVKFNKWKSELPKKLQYEGDYDLKGLWLENPDTKPSSNLHFPDTYKLPNHPTFSNESKYFNDYTKKYAGHWDETDSSYNYMPYDTTVKKAVIERKMQMGGVPIASTSNQQFTGLNDSSFNEMMFPMSGVNTFRGLDNGDPVYLEDEEGNSKILRGKNHTAKMKGRVYEKHLK